MSAALCCSSARSQSSNVLILDAGNHGDDGNHGGDGEDSDNGDDGGDDHNDGDW